MKNKIILRVVTNICNLAKMKGILKGQLEKDCGMPIGKLSRFPNLRLTELEKIARYLGVSIDELISANTEKQMIELQIKKLQEQLDELTEKKENEYYE